MPEHAGPHQLRTVPEHGSGPTARKARVRLNTVFERLEALLQEATKKMLSYADFLHGLLTAGAKTRARGTAAWRSS